MEPNIPATIALYVLLFVGSSVTLYILIRLGVGDALRARDARRTPPKVDTREEVRNAHWLAR